MSTARGVALVRAAEMMRPEAERVASDPYAQAFVNPIDLFGLRLMRATGMSRLMGIEPMLTFAIAREQFVHDLMVREARAGLAQVVILGAGFDTRAYRIEEVQSLPVFEVDHPRTQAQKRAALAGVVDPLPANVRFVGVDFEIDDLGERLGAAGYREEGRTLFVWQGVTMYLTPEGIDRTLGFVARHSGDGSVLAFDYFDAGELARGGSRALKLFTRLMGETIRFGLDQSEIEGFLTARGFAGIENVDGDELARLHLSGGNTGRPMAEGVAVVSARVARPPSPSSDI